jgi:hypothetical protein
MSPVRTRLVLALLLGLAAFTLYSRSLWSGFVYDAQAQIQEDSYIHTPAHFADVVTLRVLAQDVLDGTRPVYLFSVMIDSLFWGRNPFGYHLTSNLLHAINATLLFLLLARLAERVAPNQPQSRVLLASALGALIFIAHPILTEPVAEVSDREDLLALFFILAAFIPATYFPCRERWKTFLAGSACIFLLFLSAGSKESGIAGPPLLALYAWLFQRDAPRKPWIALIVAAFVVVGVFTVARFTLQPEVSRIFVVKPQYIGGSFMEMLHLQPRVWTFLFANTAWPLNLSADYQPQNVAPISLTVAIISLLSLLAVQAFLSFKSRLAFFGTAVFWLGLAPVSNFIPIYWFAADRFLYMPMAGVAATVCAALLLVKRTTVFRFLSASLFTISLAFACLTWQRQAVFANSLNLWTDTFAKTPFSPSTANNLGYALSDEGEYEEALKAFGRALALSNQKHADSWAGAAITLEKMGRIPNAQSALQKAIALDSRYGEPQKMVEAIAMSEEHALLIEEILSHSRPTTP